MTLVTPSRLRAALAAAAVVLAAVACDSGDDIQGERDQPGGSTDSATDVPSVPTDITLQNVGRQLDAVHRERLKTNLASVLDPFFDEAYLGEFPREDYSAAYASFTRDAAQDAERDLDVLSSAPWADQIEGAVATKRRVRVDVFAVDGHPRGVTAHFVLEFDTEGELEQSVRVRGDLYLTKVKNEWKIFGYDVDQAEAL